MKAKIILLVAVLGLTFSSCHKDDGEGIVDCFGDSILLIIHHSEDPSNTHIVNFTMHYSGSNTITGIDWNFGDGQTAHSTGTTISHTFASPGTFTVKGNTTLNKTSGNCTVNVPKEITVE